MCGRFSITVLIEELMERFLFDAVPFDYMPRYNAAPGQPIPAVIAQEGRNRIGQLRWGLIPSWAEDEKIGYKTINAKAETLQEKASFRMAFERRRCLIPADGFYEWKPIPGRKEKQPLRIRLKGGGLFGMAGLYDTWTSADGRKISSCTVITTAPNGLVRDIHNRMPVILRREDEALWLDRSRFDPRQLQSLLVPYPEGEMEAYPVNPLVGNVRHDGPSLIEEYREQLLF